MISEITLCCCWKDTKNKTTYFLKYGKMGIKGKYVRKFKSSIQCLGWMAAEKEIIFSKDCFTISNKALRPIDLLCKC